MPTKEEWIRVHAELMAKLSLPCVLKFDTSVKIGLHHFTGDYWAAEECWIAVNPDCDFKVPEHLILHEGAHHRACQYGEYHGHDEYWAHILCQFYKATGVALPYSTGFETFAKEAGIKHKVFVKETPNG